MNIIFTFTWRFSFDTREGYFDVKMHKCFHCKMNEKKGKCSFYRFVYKYLANDKNWNKIWTYQCLVVISIVMKLLRYLVKYLFEIYLYRSWNQIITLGNPNCIKGQFILINNDFRQNVIAYPWIYWIWFC